MTKRKEAIELLKSLAKSEDSGFSAPEAARKEAKQGLEWRREHGRGGTEVGVARARDIARGAKLSEDTIKRMISFFARHEGNKKAEGWSPGDSGYPSNGRIAWALWGGDAGRSWAESMSDKMDSDSGEDVSKALTSIAVIPMVRYAAAVADDNPVVGTYRTRPEWEPPVVPIRRVTPEDSAPPKMELFKSCVSCGTIHKSLGECPRCTYNASVHEASHIRFRGK